MNAKQRNSVEMLLEKAAESHDAGQAVNYAQAACNAANALRALADIEVISGPMRN